MKVSLETRTQVNIHMAQKFKSKGTAGYSYFKRILEFAIQDYKDIGYINRISLRNMHKRLNAPVTYSAFQKSINYFMNKENMSESLADAIVTEAEKIIDHLAEDIVDEEDF